MTIFNILEFALPVAALVVGALAAVNWKKLDHDKRCWAIFIGITICFSWSYLNSMEKVAQAWKSPQYSHGWLIPVIAAALLYLKRKKFTEDVPMWQQATGAGLIIVATLVRLYSAQMAIFTIDRVMLIPSVMGLFLLIGGLNAFKWSFFPTIFLAFMYPFPTAAERMLLNPLQSLATRISHYSLETLGIECYREGNRIVLDGVEMGVVDACSGLRMLTIFMALAFAIAIVATNRPLWERVVLFFPSSILIALAVNSIRITLTGLAYHFIGNEGEMVRIITTFFHNFAGLIMMPMAMGFLYLEYKILSQLIIEDEPEQLSPIGMS